ISGVVGQLSFRLSMEASTLEQFKSSTTVSIIGALIGIPLDLIALVMVKAIAHRQNQLVTPPDPEPEWA
ncbi:MAG TPA: hypothetical protein VFT74_20820, partial [Isosphaeraceae bacterium]|nr:hypothetical protein [Isosphaeraceae bacterium]